MGTAIVLLVLVVTVSLVVRSIIRDHRSGRSSSCGGDCSHCRKCS